MVNHSAVQPEDADLQHDMVPDAARALASGALAIIIDDGHPDGLGYLIMAAELARWEPMSFLVRHTSGFLCVALPSDRADALDLPPMVPGKGAPAGPAFAVSVDARDGITTGISARDRARTVRLLADSATTAVDLCRPGHVMPIRTHTDGVRGHAQVPEAAVDLCRLAGVAPGAVLCEIVAEDGSLPNRAILGEFAREHRLPVVTVRQLVTYQKHRSGSVQAVAVSRLPTAFGTFTAHAYRSSSGAEHLALMMGDPEHATPPLVRVHSECLTGDVLTSLRCDCGTQLTDSLRIIAEARTGVLIYLRGHEGRGIGLAAKVAAYQLQDEGYDTVDANVALGEPVDGRHYADAALILEDLHLRRIRLLTNNPDKHRALTEAGIDVVERVPLPPSAIGEDNISYLRTKSSRMGHLITDLGNPA